MVAKVKSRTLTPGTTGWCADDLDNPVIRRQWEEQRVEMVHGVIAQMPPAAAYFDHSSVVDRLFFVMRLQFEAQGIDPLFGSDVDLAVDETVVYRADGIMLLPGDVKRQLAAQRQRGQPTDAIRGILIPPSLIVESASIGHEKQDHIVKKRDYARFGAPNYWIINQHRKSLECYRLEAGQYVLDASGKSPKVIKPRAFEGLTIQLKKVFR